MNDYTVMVSVAVITYKMERYLRKLLESILQQKVSFQYEIVIDDDYSPDNSRSIIREYQEKFPEIIHPIYRHRNVGGSRNMYGVMQKCQGKYIAILEGDDFWEGDNKLQYQIDFLEEHPEYIGMTCNSWCEHEEIPTCSHLMRRRTEPKVFSFQDFMALSFLDRLPSSTDTWVFRNFWHDGGDYSLFFRAHRMIWDQSLILILYGKGIVYADPSIVSHHRSISTTTGENYQSIIRQKNCLYEDSKMYQEMEKYIENNLKVKCEPFYKVRGEVWIDAIFRALKSRDKRDWIIARRIWRDQNRKGMLLKRLLEKSLGILGRKLRNSFLKI